MTSTAEPEIVTVEPAATAVVRATVPMAELPGFYDRAFSVLPRTLAAQQITVVGPAFGLYHGIPGETVDLEVGLPTDRLVEADGEVRASSLPGGRLARLVHVGAFDGLGQSWERLGRWIGEQGLRPGGPFWEVYRTEPSPDMDPRDLRTELYWPLA